MKTTHLQHKSGGRITEVKAVAHSTYEGAAAWYFKCTVEWNDGGMTENADVSPVMLCYAEEDDTGKQEADAALKVMTDYLQREGRWLRKGRQLKNGCMVFWVPKRPSGQQAM